MKKIKMIALLMCIVLIGGCGKKPSADPISIKGGADKTKDKEEISSSIEPITVEDDIYSITVTPPDGSTDIKAAAYDSVFYTTKDKIIVESCIINLGMDAWTHFKEVICINDRPFDIFYRVSDETGATWIGARTPLGRSGSDYDSKFIDTLLIDFVSEDTIPYEQFIERVKELLEGYEFSDTCYKHVKETSGCSAFLVSQYNTACTVEYTPSVEEFSDGTHFTQTLKTSTNDVIEVSVTPSNYVNYNPELDLDAITEWVSVGDNMYYYYCGENSNGTKSYEYAIFLEKEEHEKLNPSLIKGQVLFVVPADISLTDSELRELTDNYVAGITWYKDTYSDNGPVLEVVKGGMKLQEFLNLDEEKSE